MSRVEELLGRVKLFNRVPPAKRQSVLRRMQAIEFPEGRVIIDQQSPIRVMFIVAEGEVQLRRRDASTGVSFLLRTLKAGDSFGEMSLLADQPYNATLMTTRPSVLFLLNQESFHQLVVEEPEISMTLNRLLAEQLSSAYDHVGVRYTSLGDLKQDEGLLSRVPLSLMKMHHLIPIAQAGNVVTVAMVNPSNLIAFDDLKRVLRGVSFEPVMITEDDFTAFLEKVAPAGAPKRRPAKAPEPEESLEAIDEEIQRVGDLGGDLMGTIEGELAPAKPEQEEDQLSLADIEVQVDSGPIVKLANNLLLLALREGASDIHVEPQARGVVIRYRIDGAMKVIQTLPRSVLMGLISRLKILASLDITIRRIPQDGRISIMYRNRRVDFRVNTVPTKFGEKVCMRVLDNSMAGISLDKLIADPASLGRWRDSINQPYGIIFVTGPTGSGKTTTLYSSLAELNTPDVNISTVEDPVEYDLPGLIQVQVDKPSGMDFAKVLRAFLRQDPDIILVGETRDTETAKIAIEAALTGHLVFTTLHTNSAAASFMRLEEMGVEPFMVSCATVALVAQRLARKICDKCKEAYTPPVEQLDYCGFAPGELTVAYRGKGCETCQGRGMKGRVGIYEVMVLDDELKGLISRRARTEEIHAAAVAKGMVDLAAYARMMVKEGRTTLEEVIASVSFR